MDVVRALVSVHRLEVHGVADHVILVRHAISAMHVARDPRDVQGFPAGVALGERDHLRGRASLVHQPPDA